MEDVTLRQLSTVVATQIVEAVEELLAGCKEINTLGLRIDQKKSKQQIIYEHILKNRSLLCRLLVAIKIASHSQQGKSAMSPKSAQMVPYQCLSALTVSSSHFTSFTATSHQLLEPCPVGLKTSVGLEWTARENLYFNPHVVSTTCETHLALRLAKETQFASRLLKVQSKLALMELMPQFEKMEGVQVVLCEDGIAVLCIQSRLLISLVFNAAKSVWDMVHLQYLIVDGQRNPPGSIVPDDQAHLFRELTSAFQKGISFGCRFASACACGLLMELILLQSRRLEHRFPGALTHQSKCGIPGQTAYVTLMSQTTNRVCIFEFVAPSSHDHMYEVRYSVQSSGNMVSEVLKDRSINIERIFF